MTEPARVGLLLGDPCGIGPEIVAQLLASDALDAEVATVVIGEPRIARARRRARRRRASAAGDRPASERCPRARRRCWPGRRSTRPRRRSARSARSPAGRARHLPPWRSALAHAGELDAICFAPCNKQAMHQGGLDLEDELRFFVQMLGFKGHVGEVNATGGLATTRVTSHVPLRAVADLITEDGVLQAIRLARRHAARRRQAAPADRGRRASIRTPATAASSAARRSR